MAIERKLQVFISSTFLDLKEERQAAVEAILEAQHIPAGMELFSGGDKSQMEVIKRWIENSDIFVLILGGRYGSIEPETGKSYIQLEYEYALKIGKPFFANIMTEEGINNKSEKFEKEKLNISVIEAQNQTKYMEFIDIVKTRLCNFFTDTNELKLKIIKSINLLADEHKFSGWVRVSHIGLLNLENNRDLNSLGNAKNIDFIEFVQSNNDRKIHGLSLNLLSEFNEIYKRFLNTEDRLLLWEEKYENFEELVEKEKFIFLYINSLLMFSQVEEYDFFISKIIDTILKTDFELIDFIKSTFIFHLVINVSALLLKNDKPQLVDNLINITYLYQSSEKFLLNNISFKGEGWSHISERVLNNRLPLLTLIKKYKPQIIDDEEFNSADSYIALNIILNNLNMRWFSVSCISRDYILKVFIKYFRSSVNQSNYLQKIEAIRKYLDDSRISSDQYGFDNLIIFLQNSFNTGKS